MKIYVASSWRNDFQQNVVRILCKAGHMVYDFKKPHPEMGDKGVGFHWSEIDPNWKCWSPEKFRDNLSHVLAVQAFYVDYNAMSWADACVLVNPCGRSAHLEAGYFVGANKRLFILLTDGEPELMYNMADKICFSIDEVVEAIKKMGV